MIFLCARCSSVVLRLKALTTEGSELHRGFTEDFQQMKHVVLS